MKQDMRDEMKPEVGDLENRKSKKERKGRKQKKRIREKENIAGRINSKNKAGAKANKEKSTSEQVRRNKERRK